MQQVPATIELDARPTFAGDILVWRLVVIGAWLAFGVLNTLVRIGPGANLAAADALSMVAAQEFRLAYQIGQPPLYEWLLWYAQQLLGPTLLSAYVLKYVLTLVAGITVFEAATRIARDAAIGAIASLSLMALFNVGFTIHDQSTHSVAMIAAIGVTFLAFVLVAERGDLVDYAMLGTGIAFGLLSKYGFALFPAAMTAAFLMSPALRSSILAPRIAVALAIPLLTVGPFLLWVLGNSGAIGAELDRALLDEEPGWRLTSLANAIGQLFAGYAVYAAPAVPLLWLCWPFVIRRGPTVEQVRSGDLRAVLGLSLLVAFVVALGLMIVLDAETMRSRYLHALALLLPVYVALFIPPAEAEGRPLTMFLGLLAAMQLGQVAVRAVTPLAPTAPFCTRCGVIEPLGALAQELWSRGWDRATVYAPDHRIAGNLRVHLPALRITTNRMLPPSSPPDAERPCVRVEAVEGNGVEWAGALVEIVWPKASIGPERVSRFSIYELDPANPRCR